MSSPPDRDRIAFVLSGGASLGAVQVGMLHALYERGVVPHLVVGTSVGAVNGAFIALRPQTVQTASELAEIWRKLRRGQIFPLNPLSGLLGFLGSRDHLVPDSGLRKLVAEHTQHQRLEQMPIDFHVVAVDVVTGEELLLSRGPALDAVLASAAIPAVLPPVTWEDRTLMDGGVANNTPISHAVQLICRVVCQVGVFDRVRVAGGLGWSGGRGAGLGVGVASLMMRGLGTPGPGFVLPACAV